VSAHPARNPGAQKASPEADQEKIWDYFQNEGLGAFAGSRARLAHLARTAKRRARGRASSGGPATVLNIGVGAGIFEHEAARAGLRVHCVDPSERAIRRVAELEGLGERARVGTSEALPFEDASFDAVVVSELLEHLAEATLDATLAEAERVLTPGGTFLGTVPARENLEENRVVCPSCGEHFHRWGHQRSFDTDGLHELLSARFADVRIRQRPFPSWGTLNWKGRVGGALRLLLARIDVHGAGESLVFEATRSGHSHVPATCES